MGDAAQLLDVQVDQIAWPWVLIAADRPAGGAVQPGQPVHSVADQYAVHGGGGKVESGGDAGWAEPLVPAQPEDPLFQPDGGPPGAVGRNAGPVDQAGCTQLLVAAPPAVGGGPGDAHLVGDVRDRPSRLGGDPSDQGESSRRGEPGVSVRHEASDERGAGTARTSLGDLTSRQQPLWAEQLGLTRTGLWTNAGRSTGALNTEARAATLGLWRTREHCRPAGICSSTSAGPGCASAGTRSGTWSC